jgi:hypothetical protein
MIYKMIYALIDPRDLQIRYVGHTGNDSAEPRYWDHVKQAGDGGDHTHKLCWIRSLLKICLLPELWILQEDGTKEDEVIYIRVCKEMGYDLTNATEGGDGLHDPTGEIRKQIADKLRGRKKGPRSEETKKKISENRKGKMHSEESRLKMSQNRKGKIPGGDWRKNMSASRKGKKRSPEVCAAISRGHMGHPGVIFTDEARRKISEAGRGRVKSEETRRKLKESWTPERKARQSEFQSIIRKLWWKQKKEIAVNEIIQASS